MDFDSIKYWIKENSIVVFLVAFFIVLIPLMLILKPATEEEQAENIVSQYQNFKQYEGNLEQNFAVMNIQVDNNLNPNRPSYKVDLFLKNPFISEEEYKARLEEFYKLFVWKYSKEDKDIYVSAVKVNVYDRKILFDMQKLARDSSMYIVKNVDEKDEIKLKEYNQAENQYEYLYNYSSSVKTKPDYNNYMFTSDFLGISNDKKEDSIPLTDTEIKFLLKVFDYNVLLNSELDSTRGLDLLLLWEYGVEDSNISEQDKIIESENIRNLTKYGYSDMVNRLQQYYEFNKRFYLNNTSYGKSDYQNRLLAKYPKLAYYIATKKIAKSNLEAKQKLIKIERINTDIYSDSKSYLDIFIEDAKEKLLENNIEDSSENVNKYINSNGNIEQFKKDNNIQENKDLNRVKEAQKEQENITEESSESKENNETKIKEDFSDDSLE